jgi:hypothetical protein
MKTSENVYDWYRYAKSMIKNAIGNNLNRDAIYQYIADKPLDENTYSYVQIPMGNQTVDFCIDKEIDERTIGDFVDIVNYICTAYGKTGARVPTKSKFWRILMSNYRTENLDINDIHDKIQPHGENQYYHHQDCVHMITSNSSVLDKWLFRHEAVHLADILLGVTNDLTASILPTELDTNALPDINSVSELLEISWQDKLRAKQEYCNKNKAEQFVVDVLSKMYNIPSDVMLNLAQGVYSDFKKSLINFSTAMVGAGMSSRELKKEAKKFIKEHVLPKGYPHYYPDVVNIFKSKNSWMI